jgi:glycerol-3-phosphate dehydrogenase subunit B
MKNQESVETRLAIIGSGLAGMAAAIFAAQKEIPCVLLGRSGTAAFPSGLLDLLGTLPFADSQPLKNPLQAIEQLSELMPQHPYAKLSRQEIQKAFSGFLSSLAQAGLDYMGHEQKNSLAIGPAGELKPTFKIPRTMWPGIQAYEQKAPCLLLDFKGLKDFSSKLMASKLQKNWPKVRHSRIEFPETAGKGEIFLPLLAHALENPAMQEKLIKKLKAILKDEKYLGIPAVLGINSSQAIHQRLEQELGINIFEIPTLPPSVPGLRLQETCLKAIYQSSVQSLGNSSVQKIQITDQANFQIQLQADTTTRFISSKAIILASGRFLGQGLYAQRNGIVEPLFNLPVFQPQSRKDWHQKDFFDPHGHNLNQAGLEINSEFQPLDQKGKLVHDNLFTAGSILAHQDWIRMKCGSGLAICSAFKAVQACRVDKI